MDNYYKHIKENNAYYINPNISSAQISEIIQKKLAQIEALTDVGMFSNFDLAFGKETLFNYLWLLQDVINEIRFLYEQVNNFAYD